MRTGLLPLAALILVLWNAAAAAAGIDAWLDRNRVAEGETVQLTLEASGQVSDRPETAPLQEDFEVLGLSTGNRVTIVNGRTDARTTWTLTLSPKHSGTLTVPALRVGGGRSKPLQLEVSAAPVAAAGSDADILLETELTPQQPYVQGQVLYTVRLLHAVPLSSGELSEPQPENTLVQKLGEDREYATTRNGRRYQVIERRYALFPQASGVLQLAAPVFDGEVPDASRGRASPFQRFFGNDPFFGGDPFGDLLTPSRRVRVRGEPAELEVRARPAAAHGAHWLPAAQLRLQGEWQPPSGEIRVGEPVTLALEIEARGLTGGQLPSPAPESAAGFRVYPDQEQRETRADGEGVTGTLQQKIAFIPSRAGELRLPDIVMNWWDTRADHERQVTLPGRVLRVLPAAARPAQDTVPPAALPAASPVAPHAADTDTPATAAPGGARTRPAPAAVTGFWPWVSAGLAGGWLLTLVLGWRHLRKARAGATGSTVPAAAAAGAARRRFHRACAANDAAGARRALLDWAALHWPAHPPRGLDDLARRLDHAQVRAALRELDRVLYRGGAEWDGKRLAQHLQRLPVVAAASARDQAVLAPLYPAAGRSRA